MAASTKIASTSAIARTASWARNVSPTVPLLLVLSGFLAVALAYARLTPLGEAPDELSHLGYVHSIVANHALPSGDIPERQQPPLYYVVAAVVYASSHSDQAIRLVSVALGCATLVAIWAAARTLAPGWNWLAALPAASVAAVPEFQYISGAVNDDALAWLAGALVVLLTIRVVRAGAMTPRLAVAVGTTVGVAILSKETVWLPAAVLAAVMGIRCLRARRPGLLSLMLALGAIISAWWFVRNLATFHSLLPPLTPFTTHRQFLTSLDQVSGYVSLLMVSSVGMYGPGAHLIPLMVGSHPIKAVEVGACVVAVGLLLAVTVSRAWQRWSTWQRTLAGVFALMAAVVVAQLLVNSIFIDDQPEGRYLLVLASLPAIACAWLAARELPRYRTAVAAGGLALLLVVAIIDINGVTTAASLRG